MSPPVTTNSTNIRIRREFLKEKDTRSRGGMTYHIVIKVVMLNRCEHVLSRETAYLLEFMLVTGINGISGYFLLPSIEGGLIR